MRLMVVSDLHDGRYADILPMLTGADALLVPGDVVDRYRQRSSRGLAFLRDAAAIVPTYFGMGNHEARLKGFAAFRTAAAETGAHMLFNSIVRHGELAIGCWYQPEDYGHADILPALAAEGGVRILLCHKPEDYMARLRGAQVELALAGHAHGGQIRIGGRGLYAPGQGILPRYTYGVWDGRLIITSGASNAVPVPRWGNPCEVLRIDLD
jgi:hypothetical protein